MADEEEPLLKTAEERRSERDILVVAFLGTMDDLVVYFSVAVSGKIPGVDLIIGTTLGAVALALCVGSLLEFSERASACVAKVPIPVVLVALACYIIVDACGTPRVSFLLWVASSGGCLGAVVGASDGIYSLNPVH